MSEIREALEACRLRNWLRLQLARTRRDLKGIDNLQDGLELTEREHKLARQLRIEDQLADRELRRRRYRRRPRQC